MMAERLVENSDSASGHRIETINHPQHYGGDGIYETIRVIEAWKLGFNLGNAIKYISRAGKKPNVPSLEDLLKAKWYINREIENIKLGQEGPRGHDEPRR